MKELVDRSILWEFEDPRGGKMPNESLKEINQTNVTAVTEEATIPSFERNRSNQCKVKEGGRDGLREFLQKFSLEAKDADQKDIIIIGIKEKEFTSKPDIESPVLVAAKRGIKEMVETILHKFPVAILDQDKDDKNIVLLAVEHRQVHVYNFMLNVPTMKEHVFGKVDNEGNSALHLAAMLNHSHPYPYIRGAALQMQCERKWYKYVLNSMGQEMLLRINNEGRTAQEVFMRSHETLLKDGNTWLTNTAQSCSVVAALVATVAFASVGTVPGGFDQAGFPILVERPAFQLFTNASLVALCFSVTSLVMFLAILTSSYQAKDFDSRVPVKLILGLTTLFMSIASMLVSFCAGDFVVEKKHKFVAYPIYIMCFPVMLFAVAQFPYIELIRATIKKDPEHIYFQIEDEINC